MTCGETEPHTVQEVKAVILFPGTYPTKHQQTEEPNTDTDPNPLHVTGYVFLRQTLPTLSAAHMSYEAKKEPANASAAHFLLLGHIVKNSNMQTEAGG